MALQPALLLLCLDISLSAAAGEYCVDDLVPRISGEDGVEDADITSSSEIEAYSGAPKSRLGGETSWTYAPEDKDPWIQVEFQNVMTIAAIDIMGDSAWNCYIEEFSMSHSQDGMNWSWYVNNELTPKVFEGNNDCVSIVRKYFDPRIQASFIKLYPLIHYRNSCLRWELYSCNVSYTTQSTDSVTQPIENIVTSVIPKSSTTDTTQSTDSVTQPIENIVTSVIPNSPTAGVTPSIASLGVTFAKEDPLPSVYQVCNSSRRALPKDLMDGNNMTCIRIPMAGQPPQELSIRLDGFDSQANFSLHGNGIKCDEDHVLPMSQVTHHCSGEYKLFGLRFIR
ncbi:hypothetical protein CAPTEDRAFT_205475 [Capitella teleta]|uniref:F5/8 type C domain-containing protein n=1 Tax=Capitella teleta TaxID=283909 RepID=R7UN96_CAPTE|nr:hypothetical protein CAPTEDRAFT_205475 [Capitella teleta]|eukprot:ELU05422.1 hypothetical protein CAPTEDRAFT_205475 [Capitella teleta]